MKYASIKHLACALVAALVFPTAALAATPVAVWDYAIDGQQLNTTQNGLTVNAGTGNSFVGGKLNIAGSGYYSGGYINLPENLATVSVLVKYSNFSGFSGHAYAPAFMCVRDSDKYELGLLATDNATTFVWYWYLTGGDPNTPPDQHRTGNPAFVPTSGYVLFSYNTTWGMRLCSGTSLSNMTTAEKNGYNFSGRTIKQVGIGGAPDYSWSDGWPNLVIEKVALFTNEFLSASDVASFQFPSMSASEINAKFGNASDINLELADGTLVVGDTTFTATNINFVCNGSFTILPPANNATAFGFSGVTGSPVITYTGTLPAINGDFFTSTTVPTWIADAAKWNGTIKLSSIPRQWPLTLANYANASSAVEVDGIGAANASSQTGEYLANDKLADKLILSGNGMTLTDGISYYVSEIGELAGTGSFTQDKQGIFSGLTINVMTNFTGTISPNDMTVTFGTEKRAGRNSGQGDTEYQKKLYIDSNAVLSVPAGFALWSPVAVEFNGTVNFTTDATDYNGLVLFSNIGTRQTVHFGNNAVIKINGEEYDRSLYTVKIKNSNLMLVDRRVFTIHVR